MTSEEEFWKEEDRKGWQRCHDRCEKIVRDGIAATKNDQEIMNALGEFGMIVSNGFTRKDLIKHIRANG